jgi:hypothetical protein
MSGLLARVSGYEPDALIGSGPRYHRVVYLTAPAAQRCRPPPPSCPAACVPGWWCAPRTGIMETTSAGGSIASDLPEFLGGRGHVGDRRGADRVRR